MCNSLKTASCGMRHTQASGGEQRSWTRTACARAGSLPESAYTIAGWQRKSSVPSIHAPGMQAPGKHRKGSDLFYARLATGRLGKDIRSALAMQTRIVWKIA